LEVVMVAAAALGSRVSALGVVIRLIPFQCFQVFLK
jgi:hypothetical protein